MNLREQVSARVTLASRITLLATLAVGLTVAAVSIAVYFTVRVQLVNSLDDSLLRRADSAVASPEFVDVLKQTPDVVLVASDVKYAVIDPSGTKGARALISDAELAVAQGESAQSIRTVNVSGVDYRVIAVPAGEDTAVIMAQSMEPTQRTLDRLGLVFWVVGVSGVLIAGVAGWAVATNSLRPVRRLTDAAEHVAITEELKPIEITGDDELARLTIAFNSMLVALDASQRRQRQLIADAGHELRTPLTSLRTNIELLAQADKRGDLKEEARSELLTDIRAQIEEMSTLVGDLVELARDELLVRGPEPADLGELLDAAIERVRRRAPGITFEVDAESWLVLGDPHLLERAITNLLDNAAKWSPPLGTVRVRLDEGALTVTDEGAGIADADLPHIFERFYRSTESRTLPGSGLGLAIVQQTAHRHGGTVAAGNTESGGAIFRLWIPGQRSPVRHDQPADQA
ncbi:MAG TPA: HAMP domain-containing sensor histidine kinase [Nocardioidaceae bacterium]|nr:HAMP domain-containing sensor histidine kinase [Nocardioidaceae bacterium]